MTFWICSLTAKYIILVMFILGNRVWQLSIFRKERRKQVQKLLKRMIARNHHLLLLSIQVFKKYATING